MLQNKLQWRFFCFENLVKTTVLVIIIQYQPPNKSRQTALLMPLTPSRLDGLVCAWHETQWPTVMAIDDVTATITAPPFDNFDEILFHGHFCPSLAPGIVRHWCIYTLTTIL